MNVTEFAEQVVFGTRLEDKLTSPGSLLDDADARPSFDVKLLISPGRPVGLEMQNGPGAAKPPSDTALENEKARGCLLHFLANHELLATELMALVLLKFPDAPSAFRRGVLATLKEEQAHTRLYLKRMKECGIEFGSFPLSGHFWRLVESMREPIDFVSRLSLTFEQANLDYSLHYANVFRQIGDVETARILQHIYEDEIGHVKHGLHWFRQWKDPVKTDWDAYQNRLTFPMSPQRARGPKGAFNRAGRREAGLSDDFIDKVELFRQSRGRTPTVRWFDPGAEAELAATLGPREQQLMEQLGKDLEGVMIPLSRQDDLVLVRRTPSMSFRRQLLNAGVELPEFISFDQMKSLSERRIHDFAPWAWTPKNHEFIQPLLSSTHQPPPPWSADQSELYRKSWSAKRLREWLPSEDSPEWFTTTDCVAVSAKDESDVASAIARFGSLGYANVLVKQDLATSGRGQRRLSCGESMGEVDRSWIAAIFDAGAVAIVEPELDRVLDLSFLWKLSDDVPKFLGWTHPLVTPGRRYSGTRLGRFLPDGDTELTRFVLEDGCARLNAVREWLEPRFTDALIEHGFSGHFGVDAFVCRDASGALKIKPIVELNPRVTMGHIALALRPRLTPRVRADFRILTRREWDSAHAKLESLPLTRSGDGCWNSGVVWFGEVDEHTKLVPVLLIGSEAVDAVDGELQP